MADTISPLMETTPQPAVQPQPTGGKKTPEEQAADKAKYKKYGMIIAIAVVVLLIIYYSYSCFCFNQTLGGNEPFIEKTVKSGTDSDKSFDIDAEVRRLSDLQEQYLRKLNRR
jgi:hypothetical protein